MADIKVKNKNRDNIKTLDKTKIATQKFKQSIIKAKNITQNSYDNLSESKDEENVNEYTTNKLNNAIRVTKDKGLDKFNQYGRKGIKETKKNIEITKQKLDLAKKRSHARKVSKGIIKGSEKQIATIKTAERTSKKSVKNSIKTGGKVIKTTENNALVIQRNTKLQAKTAQKTAKIIKESAKQVAKVSKDTIKSVIRAIRAIIAATKALIMFLIAGGWIVALIVIVICMIGMLVSSIFGIFFSGENIGDGSKSMTSVISELNQEFIGKITQIQTENPYEEFDINGSRASWKDVLAVYVAKYSNGDYKTEMMTLDENKISQLKQIFWDMNEVSFTKEVEKEEKVILHLTWTEYKTIEHVKLHIKINSKTALQMADQYNFSVIQKVQLNDLLQDEYLAMWSQVIYGTSGNSDIVSVAQSQIGNVGGEPYWSWYGFNSRVEWCACFVSCAPR